MSAKSEPININIDELLLHAKAIARDAGHAIMEVYSTDFSVEQKHDSSPLTLADSRSHEIISERLSLIPGCSLPLLSEEGKDIPYTERKNWEYFWLVDPLDGTKEFIKRNGQFTVNIALIHRDRPVLGVIYVPVSRILYYSADKMGAYREEQEVSLKLPLRTPRKHFTLVGSRSHATHEQEEFIEKMRKKHGEADFISAGSSLKFCLVAEGKADIYPRFGPTMEWDTAAGQAIIEQAGGSVSEIKSGIPLVYNKTNLMNPFFFASMPSQQKA